MCLCACYIVRLTHNEAELCWFAQCLIPEITCALCLCGLPIFGSHLCSIGAISSSFSHRILILSTCTVGGSRVRIGFVCVRARKMQLSLWLARDNDHGTSNGAEIKHIWHVEGENLLWKRILETSVRFTIFEFRFFYASPKRFYLMTETRNYRFSKNWNTSIELQQKSVDILVIIRRFPKCQNAVCLLLGKMTGENMRFSGTGFRILNEEFGHVKLSRGSRSEIN